MDKNEFKLTAENDEISQEKIKEYLKEMMPRDAYNNYIDFFEFESIDNKKIVVGYYGTEPLQKFNEEYKELVWIHICSLVGYSKKFKIYKRKTEIQKATSVKIKKNIKVAKLFAVSFIFAAVALSVAVIGVNYVLNRNFKENFYSIGSLKVDSKIRIIQISDLHNSKFGKDNAKLIDRIKKLKPDIIVYTGDIIDSDDKSEKNVLNLTRSLSEVAPSYYVYGNNEVEKIYGIPMTQEALDKKLGFKNNERDTSKLSSLKDDFEKKLEENGVKVLKNETDSLSFGTTVIDIYGVLTSNPSSFWSYADKSFEEFIHSDTTNLKIMLVHEPFIFQEFTPDTWGDIILCGHTHGGVIRVPLFGPLYTQQGGFFPERNGDYVYGRYNVSGGHLIVSGGMENKNFLRINNSPELIIADINKF